MKNKRNYIVLLLILAMLISTVTLTGCQLALPANSTEINTDKLCGVFVTIGYQYFPMNEDALNKTDITFNSKGEISFDDTALSALNEHRVDGRLTAEKNNVIFDGFEGYYMGIAEEINEDGVSSEGLICDPNLTDVKYAVNITDTTEENTCEATLYVSKEFNEIFYLNRVYITSDGNYYTVLGNSQGASFSGETSGSTCSQTIDTEYTKTHGNSSKSEKSSFKINVTTVDEVQKIIIKEMDQNDELIKVSELLPDSPEEFVVGHDTSYVIVEELLNSSSEENSIKRSIYTPLSRASYEASNQHYCNCPGENDLIARKLIKFIYSE